MKLARDTASKWAEGSPRQVWWYRKMGKECSGRVHLVCAIIDKSCRVWRNLKQDSYIAKRIAIRYAHWMGTRFFDMRFHFLSSSER